MSGKTKRACEEGRYYTTYTPLEWEDLFGSVYSLKSENGENVENVENGRLFSRYGIASNKNHMEFISGIQYLKQMNWHSYLRLNNMPYSTLRYLRTILKLLMASYSCPQRRR